MILLLLDYFHIRVEKLGSLVRVKLREELQCLPDFKQKEIRPGFVGEHKR